MQRGKSSLFEHRSKPVIPFAHYLRRQILFIIYAIGFLSLSLFLGTAGYHHYGHLNWIDAFYNASMILTGMGPVATLETDPAKCFASLYALYSGVAFLTTTGVMFAPLIHRLLHRLQADIPEE